MARPELAIEDLQDKIPGINAANRSYYEGDHWQDGNGWSGPMPPADHDIYQGSYNKISSIFTSKDILKEIRQRERWALTGKSWTWNMQDENYEPIDEETSQKLRNALSRWLKEKKVTQTVAKAIDYSGWCAEDGEEGRGILRFYIPQQRLENGAAKAETLLAALMMIELEASDPATATIIEDADTEYEPVGFISWKEEKAGEEYERAELVYVNENGMTVIENMIDNEITTSGEVEHNLHGNLTMYEIRRPLLIDESMRSLQRFHNHVNTAFQAAIQGAAWPEDFFIGILPPGDWEDDGSGTGAERYVSEPLIRGAGRTHFLQPTTILEADGTERAVQAGRHSRTDPMNPELFIRATEMIQSQMMASAFQSYTEITGMAQASGEKLQLARGDFEAATSDLAMETARMVRWILETALRLGQVIEGATEPDNYNIAADVKIDTGIVTAQHKLILSQLRSEGFIPHDTALAEAGYSNPAELIMQIIKAEEERRLEGTGVIPGAVDATGGDNGTDMNTEMNTVNTPRRVQQKAINNQNDQET